MADHLNFQHYLPAELYKQAVSPGDYKLSRRTAKKGNEISLSDDWSLVLDNSCGPLTKLAASDFVSQTKRVFGIKLRQRKTLQSPCIRISASDPSMSAESYQRNVGRNLVEIVAGDDEGGMRALFHLQRELLNRRGPFLKIGKELRSPKWPLRITCPLLYGPMDEPEGFLSYPRQYLLNMARYGYNATYIFVNLLDYVSPKTNQYLSRPGWKKRVSTLREAARHFGKFGVRLFVHYNIHALAGDHELFEHNPRSRGAQTFGIDRYCLCSSSPEILSFYREATEQLLSEVPELAGLVLIVGGECFVHCYSRPTPKTAKGTNCPHCGNLKPEDVISNMVNYVVQGAKQANKDSRILVWPYSAFLWGDIDAQVRMLEKCDPVVEALVTFEKDSWINIQGKKSYVFDYSIRQIGPSRRFRAFRKSAKEQKRNVLARTETSQSIEMFNLPRIPVMYRWAERCERIRQEGVQGVHAAWRFYGFCAQRNDEIVDYFAWNDNPDPEELLKTIAQRDFGQRAADKALLGWKYLSKAFDHFPHSAGMTGLPYFRGVFYIGSAHPFIFDRNEPSLLPESFYKIDPSQMELSSDPQVLSQYRRPNFFIDMSWTLPFGPKRTKKCLKDLRRVWKKGVSALSEAVALAKGAEKARVREELELATSIGCVITSACNLLDFQILRDGITTEPCTQATLEKRIRKVQRILSNEIENASLAQKLVKRHPSIGFGSAYGVAFSAETIEAKIKNTKLQRDIMIPEFYDNLTFHLFGTRNDRIPVK